mmetsp:Transcript_19254/g.55886  ORF Transcript_19254/g.55886 Transcript_19254/m.55886 type:complete len:256 (+) Transcript_19254:241-1008(+)
MIMLLVKKLPRAVPPSPVKGLTLEGKPDVLADCSQGRRDCRGAPAVERRPLLPQADVALRDALLEVSVVLEVVVAAVKIEAGRDTAPGLEAEGSAGLFEETPQVLLADGALSLLAQDCQELHALVLTEGHFGRQVLEKGSELLGAPDVGRTRLLGGRAADLPRHPRPHTARAHAWTGAGADISRGHCRGVEVIHQLRAEELRVPGEILLGEALEREAHCNLGLEEGVTFESLRRVTAKVVIVLVHGLLQLLVLLP